MSKSVLLKSSIAKKYWMALTGLFLCVFLIGHLIGNLQLFAMGEEGRRAFNEYAYFMTHNPAVKLLSYLTYISILLHAVDGFLLAYQNRKARPIQYASNNASANSSTPARKMALLGSIVLIFIGTHMVNFWGKMHFGEIPLHTISVQDEKLYVTTNGSFVPVSDEYEVRNENQFYVKEANIKLGEGYKDLYSMVMAFFGQDMSHQGVPANKNALFAVMFYVISMVVLAYHLLHGFSSAFQSLGLRTKAYTSLIKNTGTAFAIIVPAAFAAMPIYIYLMK
jgi:succinate dehydrogenase / fumarate reductase cytochrome b subunit